MGLNFTITGAKPYPVDKEIVVITGTKEKKQKALKEGQGRIMFAPEVKVFIEGRSTDLEQVKSSSSAYSICLNSMEQNHPNMIETQELFGIMLLNNQNMVIGIYFQTLGTQNSTQVDVGLISSAIAATAAKGAIIFHNHPSGITKPSEADRALTKKIKAVCELFNTQLIDSLVITRMNYYSFADNSEL
jgi:DNA repair protein RadC